MACVFGYQAACGSGKSPVGYRVWASKTISEEAPECGRAAFNRHIAPLALGLQTEMGAGFFKGHFQRPAVDEICDDARRPLRRLG